MAKSGEDLPKVLNQKNARKILLALGWTEARGGKHVIKMRKDGMRPITLPHGPDYSPGLRRSILKQAGLIKEGGDEE